MDPFHTYRTVKGVRYDTSTATLVAGDDWWDGHARDGLGGVNTFLWKTPQNRYFVTIQSQDCGMVWLRPASREEALYLFRGPLSEHRVEFDEAFPGIAAGDA